MGWAKVKGLVGILRPWFWLPALCPAIAGAMAAKEGLPTTKTLLLIGFIFGPGIPGAAEALNDFFDRKYDTLKDIKKGFGLPSSGGSGMIQRGWVSPKEVLLLSLSLFTLTTIIALAVSLVLLVIVLMAISMAVAYSAPPIRWKSRGIWGCVIQGIAYGFITFNTGWYLSCGRFGLYPWVIGLLLGILVIGYGSNADIADCKNDRKNRIKTIPVILGERTASRFYAALMILPYVIIFLLCKAEVVSINELLFLVLVLVTGYAAWQTVADYSTENASKIHIVGVTLECVAPFLFV